LEYLVTIFFPQLIHGLVIGSGLGLICIGLTLVFGVMNIVNFAHGELFMMGSFFAFTILTLIPNFWLALFGAVLLTGILSFIIERITIRPILGREHMYGLLVTFGVSMILIESVRLIWGAVPRQIVEPIAGSTTFLGTTYPTYRLFVLLIIVPLIFGVWRFLHQTRFGAILRATSQDPTMTEMLGVNIRNYYTAAFVMGGMLAAFGGVILAPITAVYHTVGADVILKAFSVVIIGGMGSFPGAIIAALIIGQVESLSTLWISHTAARILTFAFMAGILVVKPGGLFPSQEGRK
jgi:branched-chain amino acid transport system permease protein